jgi:hypothetical protein
VEVRSEVQLHNEVVKHLRSHHKGARVSPGLGEIHVITKAGKVVVDRGLECWGNGYQKGQPDLITHQRSGNFSGLVLKLKSPTIAIREIVNAKTIKWAQSLLPLRILRRGALTHADSLQQLLDVCTVTNEPGHLDVEYKEGEVSQTHGLKGRRDIDGLGAFSLPKVLCFAARAGIPDLYDVDINGSHVCALWELAQEAGLEQQCPTLKVLREHPEHFLERLQDMPESGEGYESKKQLILAVINGKWPKSSWATELHSHAKVCDLIRKTYGEKEAHMIELLRGRRRDPLVSLLSLLMTDRERRELDKMIEAAGDAVVSIEHDGVVVHGTDAAPKAAAATIWPTKAAQYPSERASFLGLRGVKMPWLLLDQGQAPVAGCAGGKDCLRRGACAWRRREEGQFCHAPHRLCFGRGSGTRGLADCRREQDRIACFREDVCKWAGPLWRQEQTHNQGRD